MLTQALLIAFFTGLAGIDLFDVLTHFHRPVVMGPLVGLILGDVKTGLIVGGTLELVWIGMVPLAGAQPPNVVIGGVIGTAFAVLTKCNPQVAVGVAIPFAIAVQGCITLLFTLYSPVMHKCDKMVEKLNWRGVEWANYAGMIILFCFYFLISFLPIYYGTAAASHLVQQAPTWLLDGLAIAGGMMPAIGFAMLMKIMFKANYIAYFILGFLAVTYLKLPILPVALGALAIALIDFFSHAKDEDNKVKLTQSTQQEEFEDGI